ncbi:MAG: hypothetical protein WCK86_11415 [Planctomycetia bacterium]
MKDFDAGLEYARSFSIRSDLSTDGQLLLKIASQLLKSTIRSEEDFFYVRGQAIPNLLNSDVVVFIKTPDSSLPASSGAEYVSISQSFAALLRTMCLRCWADSGVLPELENGGLELYFPRDARSEIPWGAELLWATNDSLDIRSDLSVSLMPDWLEAALKSLSVGRRSHFDSSCAYALLFTLLHELGHIQCGHFSDRRHIGRYEQELEADSFAMESLFYSGTGIDAATSSKETILQMTIGILSCLVVFHLLLIRNSPATAGRTYHQGYPTVSDRVAQMIRVLQHRNKSFHSSGFCEMITVVRALLDVASLHPAFGFVIGTGWVSHRKT